MLALVLLACRAGPEGHPGSIDDLVCDDVAASYAAPEPWAVASEAYLDHADWFDASPFHTSQVAAFRGLFDLAPHEDQLFLGIGDWENNIGSTWCPELPAPCPHVDAPGHGMIVPWLAPDDPEPTWDLRVHEEAVARLRRTSAAVLLPGTDPTLGDGTPACAKDDAPTPCPREVGREHPSFARGSVWIHDGAWRRGAMPRAYHVLDITVWDGGVLYAAGASESLQEPDPGGTNATVWRSDDDGTTWRVDFSDHSAEATEHERFWLLIGAGDTVYAHGTRLPDEQDTRELSRMLVAGAWMPAPGFLAGARPPLKSEPFDAAHTLVWGMLNGPQPGVVLVGPGGPVRGVEPVTFFEASGLVLRDAYLLCAGDLLVLSAVSGVSPEEYVVHRTRDLRTFEALVTFAPGVRMTSIASWNGSLYLGDTQGRVHRARAIQAP